MNRFWSKVNLTTPDICWEWLGSKNEDGYGHFKIGNKVEKAHRYSYIISIGNITDGVCVCHTCDNPSCVNPNHLFLGTKTDNNKDRQDKGRTARGESGGRHKLSEDNVIEAIMLYETGNYSYSRLGKLYNVDKSVIFRAITNKTWKHLRVK